MSESPRNFTTHALESLQDTFDDYGRRRATLRDGDPMASDLDQARNNIIEFAARARTSVKFIGPENGRFLNRLDQGDDGVDLPRLPFDSICLEVTLDLEDRSPIPGDIASSQPDRAIILAYYPDDSLGFSHAVRQLRGEPSPDEFLVMAAFGFKSEPWRVYSGAVLVTARDQFGTHRLSVEDAPRSILLLPVAVKFNSVANHARRGAEHFSLATAHDLGREAIAICEMCNVLQCTNIVTETIAPPAILAEITPDYGFPADVDAVRGAAVMKGMTATTVLLFDTELTDKKDGEIIEAAWLHMAPTYDLAGPCDRIDLHYIGEHCLRFKPSNPISFGSMAVHHILPEELEGYPPSAEFRLPDSVAYLVGHSIDFDWQAAGSPAHVKRIDTHAIAQWLWPDATGYSQTALIYMLEGATPETRAMVRNAHSALQDVRLNHGLLRHILKLKPEIQTWSQLWEYSEECRIPRTCPMKKYEGVLLEDLDEGFIHWCLRLWDLDPYYRKGLERVLKQRHAAFEDREIEHEDDEPAAVVDASNNEEERDEIPF